MTDITFKQYQEQTNTTAVYASPYYPYFALVEEVGELYGKFSRMFRGDDKKYTEEQMQSEVGDILWDLAQICELRGWSMQDIVEQNVQKLKERAEKQNLKGVGDER